MNEWNTSTVATSIDYFHLSLLYWLQSEATVLRKERQILQLIFGN